MRSPRAVVALVALLGAIAAQQQEQPQPAMMTTVMRLPNLVSRYDVDAPKAGGTRAFDRLVAMLRALTPANQTAARPSLQVVNRQLGTLMVRADPGQVELAKKVLQELNREPAHTRLQWSFVTLPLAKATELGLKAGIVAPTEEAAIGALVKDATRLKGTLLNVPEIGVAPLAPFAVDATGKANAPASATGDAAASAPAALKLRGEMLPLSGDEVAVAVQLVRGSLPADLTNEPGAPLVQALFRLQAGKAALVTAVEGDTATVAIVRCLAIGAAPQQEALPAKK